MLIVLNLSDGVLSSTYGGQDYSRFVILILLEEMIVGVCSRRVAELMFRDFSTGFYYEGSGWFPVDQPTHM